ncbi:3-deoxy-D-manno-octulosonic acid transferase [Sulfuriroseicoccus oceanibius]|uniref:3-deoxy-D-manno-octulosonic acid transferase n=1 Tax=Sulfuriroseicoccus oceanibius TaxID=2707525 RepID=A0A6B3L9I6_9BACT|nr:glycosyltransferase N-terminal domain-containing protein [Sulfuriroseicoccus oceanibius]QQL46167.1 hypothetical protein G3M56_006190 [Sulfuriroseicoccus oceanibius]
MRLILSLLIYNLLLPVVFVLLLPNQLLRMKKRGGYREQFGNRFGMYGSGMMSRLRGSRPLWIHAVSVGEQMIAMKLVTQLRKSGAWNGKIVVSTATSTGFKLARERVGENCEVVYFPFDLLPFPLIALMRIRPSRIVLVEAEVWPNFTAVAAAMRVPVSLVNARLSPRSARRFAKFSLLTGPIFRLLDHVCVPDADDKSRWAGLGMDESRIAVTGSMKHDDSASPPRDALVAELRDVLNAALPAPDRPVVLIASTHPGEEKFIAQSVVAVAKAENLPRPRLVVVPRHVERAGDVVADLESIGIRSLLRSSFDGQGDADAAFVANTTGELAAWYALADCVVIGKSFVGQVGGQNPAEAILCGKAVICGPRMDNFESLMECLVAADGVSHLADDSELEAALSRMFTEPEALDAMAKRGNAALAVHQGAVARTVDALGV